MAKWVGERVTPHPYQTYFDRLELKNPVGRGLPVTYIPASKPYFPNTASSREYARMQP
jgi:hypothetical protein